MQVAGVVAWNAPCAIIIDVQILAEGGSYDRITEGMYYLPQLNLANT